MADEQTSNSPTDAPPPSSDGPRRKVIKKRQSRKHRQEELEQPDEFMEVGGTLVDWVVDNLRIVGPVLGIALLGLLIGALMQKSDVENRRDASAALYTAAKELPEAENPFGAPGLSGLSGLSLETPDAGDKEEEIRAAVTGLAAVATEFEGTPQGGMAHIQAANALSRISAYDEALTHFEAAESSSGIVGRTAISGRAYTLASLKRYDEALPVFESLITQSSGGMKEQLLVDQAKLYEAKGDTARAKELYTSFEAQYPDSTLVSEVQARVSALSGS